MAQFILAVQYSIFYFTISLVNFFLKEIQLYLFHPRNPTEMEIAIVQKE